MNVRWYSHFFDDATFHLWPLYWSSHKRMQDELGVHTVTASATVQFQRELVSGDLILVDSSLNRVGGKSSTFILRMLHVDTREVHATYEVTEVFFATKTRKSTSMPTSIRQALESRMDAHFGD